MLRLKALLHCEMFRVTCLAMFWWNCGGKNGHKTFHSVTYPATAKIVMTKVARAVAKVELSSTFRSTCLAMILAVAGYVRLWNCFVQFVPPQCRQNIVRQVAQNISQCNSTLSVEGINLYQIYSTFLLTWDCMCTGRNQVHLHLWLHFCLQYLH